MKLLGLAMVLIASVAHADEPPSARRFALIIGANSGGPSRTPLRYAQSDAAAFGALLQALGGVSLEDKVVLNEPTRAEFETHIDALRQRMQDRGAATRIELIVYFSGHSDENGLMFGTDRLPYDEFRTALAVLPADVRIAIVDSCQSGALTRRKGGTMRAPFLLDTSTRIRGQAILTSSSETEAAQESDRIRGSFFTHYLLSGLRGAADVTHDRKVTLNEAYQFAFAETLARTEGTKYGAQHPGYEIELTGSGDVVMTDLRATSASLVIDDEVMGRIFVRDSEGHLVAELYKAPGRTVEIGLTAGVYAVRVEQKDARQVLEGRVTVADQEALRLTTQMLRASPLEVASRRGDDDVRHVIAAVSLWPGVPPIPPRDRPVRENLHLAIVYGEFDYLNGVALSAGAVRTLETMDGVMLGAFGAQSDHGGGGVQAAGFYGRVGGRFSGVQASGLWASGAEMHGLQASAVVAKADTTRGFQIGGVTALSGPVTGAQLSLVNVGGDVHGLQLGLVNVAKVVHGAQIGLVNVADDVHGVPFGLFSYVKSAGLGAEVWTGTTEPLNVALRYDTHHRFYSFLGAGLFAFDDLGHGDAYVGLGLGAHVLQRGKLGLDVDLMFADAHLSVRGDTNDLLLRQRISATYALGGGVSAFAGLSWQQFFGFGGYDNRTIASSFLATDHHSGDFTLRTWPSLHLGFRI